MHTLAYTVGNPDAYEPELDKGEVLKGAGGVVFATREEAESVLEDGKLPRAWFPNRAPIPGTVYGLVLDQTLLEATVMWADFSGGRKLLAGVRAVVVRL